MMVGRGGGKMQGSGAGAAAGRRDQYDGEGEGYYSPIFGGKGAVGLVCFASSAKCECSGRGTER